MTVKPKNSSWKNIDSDLFFDQGQIVMEINGLEFRGFGSIVDNRSRKKEKITFTSDIDLAQLVMSLDQEVTDEGNLYPKVEISEVAFTLHPEQFKVDVAGDLPLYKSREFEDAVKKWMNAEMSKREGEFKAALQKSEREIMSSFAFKKNMPMGASAHSTMSETMVLDGEHIVVNYVTEFDGIDLKEVS